MAVEHVHESRDGWYYCLTCHGAKCEVVWTDYSRPGVIRNACNHCDPSGTRAMLVRANEQARQRDESRHAGNVDS